MKPSRFSYHRSLACLGLATAACVANLFASAPASPFDKPTFHNDAARTGWNPHEARLTPAAVASPAFGQLWQTPRFDLIGTSEPRLFATPLYVDQVAFSDGPHRGKTLSLIFAVSDLGYVYAVNAFATGDTPAGAIIWSRRLSAAKPGSFGVISTPIIDLKLRRLYVICADGNTPYAVHALDLATGGQSAGWPVKIDAAAVNAPGINRNGAARFPEGLLIQRGALALSPDAARLYVSFAEGGRSPGWIVALDTVKPAVATAFSATASPTEIQGGMWASGGPTVDAEGHVHIVTGSSVQVAIKKLGLPGVYPESEHNWGQSVLRLRDDPQTGFELVGTYSPFNWAQAQLTDIDLGSSGTTAIDLDPASTATPRLLVLGGKQGNVYLLDRARLPGSLVKRPPMSEDASTDGSLLSPEPQPQFGTRGPLNIFGPYADKNAMNDQARGRSTPAYFRSAAGKNYVFVTGSAKTGPHLNISTPPGLARLEIVTAPGEPAHLRIDQLEGTHVFHNPGSPVVTSDGGDGAIVWVLDTNAPRTAPMQGPGSSRPVLYAFDALSFKLLWRSAPDELAPTGKYNEPTIVRGLVIVGTDRIQAFGLLPDGAAARPVFPKPFEAVAAAAPAKPAPDPQLLREGKTVFEQRCAACHNSNAPGIPTRDQIGKMDTGRIAEALRTGLMKPQATGLGESQIRAVATYVNSLGAAAAPAVPAAPTTAQPPASTSTATPTPVAATQEIISVAGRALYVRDCIRCHMPDGSSVGPGLPALRDSALVRGDATALIRTVLSGPPATTGTAHAFGEKLSDAEAADLFTYVRHTFGVGGSAVRPSDVAPLR